MKRPAWQIGGQEPDYRFTLANERTFLAWMRTSLALLAGGVLLDQFAGHVKLPGSLTAVGTALTIVAALLAGVAYLRWKGNEIAMRHSQPLPTGIAIPLLSTAICVVALVLGALLLLR